MATLTIRNLPEDVCAELKGQAERNRRSLNQEVVHTLAQACALVTQRQRFEEAMAAVDEIRKGMSSFMTAEEIDRAMDVGRR